MPGRILSLLLVALVGNAVAAQMVRFQHPSGVSFSHPANWTVREGDDGLYLVPAGAGSTPREYFYMATAPADGVASASDPAIAAYFAQLLAADVPGIARAGKATTMKTAVGQAAIIPFRGRPAGIDSDILVYVVVREGEGLYLVHVRDRGAASNPGMGRTIFASLQVRAQIDPALTGAWVRTERSSTRVGSVDPSDFSTTHLVRYEFDGRGNVLLNSDFSSASISDDVSVIDNNASLLRGRYSSLGDELYIEWEDGREASWTYSVFEDYNDGHLILKLEDPDTGKAKFYNRSRQD